MYGGVTTLITRVHPFLFNIYLYNPFTFIINYVIVYIVKEEEVNKMKFNEKIFNEAKFYEPDDFTSNTEDNTDKVDFFNEELYDMFQASDNFQLLQVPCYSLLLQGLSEYFGVNSFSKLAEKLDGVYITNAEDYGLDSSYNGLYISCGIGYDRIDEDLLGGDGTGATSKKFIEFLNK